MTYIEDLKAKRNEAEQKLLCATYQLEELEKEIKHYEDFLTTHAELINKANAELIRIKAYFENNKEAFEPMDLKLHDASYYACSKAEEDFPLLKANEYDFNDAFYDFCEINYDQMVEDFNYHGYDWNKRKQLGRTSSFWLHDNSIIDMDRRKADDRYIWKTTFAGLIDKFGWNDCCPDFTEEGLIDTNDQYLPDCEANLDYIANEFYDDIVKEFDGVIKMYDYISDFKANQVKYFKEYLQYEQDDLEYNTEQKTERALNIWLNGVAAVIG